MEVKQQQLSDLSEFLRRRGDIEAEYARALDKLTERFTHKTKKYGGGASIDGRGLCLGGGASPGGVYSLLRGGASLWGWGLHRRAGLVSGRRGLSLGGGACVWDAGLLSGRRGLCLGGGASMASNPGFSSGRSSGVSPSARSGPSC